MSYPDKSERISFMDVGSELGVHPTTVATWHTRGVRGHKLEAFRVGSRRYTTRDMLNRFLAAINSCTDEPAQAETEQAS